MKQLLNAFDFVCKIVKYIFVVFQILTSTGEAGNGA